MAKNKRKPTARTADKHVLYQESVQAPEEDAHFFARYYKKYTGRPLRVFREDFCGSAILSCEFVRRHRDNRAIGVDLHGPTLEWARKHNVSSLEPEQQKRVSLIQGNVLDVREPKAELIAGLNFSYSVFKTRKDFAAYIQNAFRALKPGGLFALDAWGGGQAQFLMKEKKKVKGATYVWHQADFDPITHHILCKIHFEFKDGSKMKTPRGRQISTDARRQRRLEPFLCRLRPAVTCLEPNGFHSMKDPPSPQHPPRRFPIGWAGATALAITLGIWMAGLWVVELRGFNPDELQHVHHAWCLSKGLVPYVDFFEHHTPWLHIGLERVMHFFDVDRRLRTAKTF